MAKMRELFTPAPPPAATVPDEPRVIRVRLRTQGDGRWYELDGWLRVPAWCRHLDGRTWRGVLVAAGLAALAVLGASCWLLRLAGRAR